MLKQLTDRTLDWIDDRSGFVTIAKEQLTKPMPPGVGYIFSLGFLTTMLLMVQIATGIALALNYAPTPDHANQSIHYINSGSVVFGLFLRSVHFYCASAVVIVIVLHMLRVLFYGAYKRPREITWMLGVMLLFVTIGFAFTGYLLPWDNKAYWATTVGTEFAKTVPFIGPWLLRAVRGGSAVGALTLMRFYTAHTVILPAALVFLMVLHIYLVRKHGSAGPVRPVKGVGEPFYPDQAYRDLIVGVVVFAVIFGLALIKPVGVHAVADPTNTHFVPVPEWYFLPMYEALKFFPGNLEFVGVMVVPGILALALFFLPWIDSNPSREPARRKAVLSATTALLVVVIGLGVLAWVTKPKGFGAGKVVAVKSSAALTPLQQAGLKVYNANGCSGCHSIGGQGGNMGPALDNVGATKSIAWLEAQVSNPKSHNPATSMPPFNSISSTDLTALANYLSSLKAGGASTAAPAAAAPAATPSPAASATPAAAGSATPAKGSASSASAAAPTTVAATAGAATPAEVAAGKKLFVSDNCSGCHAIGGQGGSMGPALDNVGATRNVAWIESQITNPKGHNPSSMMPPFSLPAKDLNDLAGYLSTLKGKS